MTRIGNPLDRRSFLASAASAASAVAAGWVAARSFARAQDASTGAQRMQQRKIPRDGASIPMVGMGTWQTFDPASLDAAALAPLEKVLDAFVKGGGRVVDSSPMYGKAEQVVGTLSERLGINRDLFLATKVWTRGEAAGIEQMQTSLARLHREQLELMQIHNLVDWRVQLKTLRKWQEQGRIKYIGITHYQLDAFAELEQILRSERPEFIQLPYSIGVRAAEERLLGVAREMRTAVLVMRPFEGGNLFKEARKRELPEFARAFASSWAEAFLKWVLGHPDVTCVLPATSNPAHMAENLQAGLGRLPDEAERKRLIEVLGA